MSEVTMDHARIAQDVRGQIQWGVFMSLGARNLVVGREDETHFGGLVFDATILPFLKSGKRGSRGRKMHVSIKLNYADYYDIKVFYWQKYDLVEHFSIADIDCFQLNNLLLALDYDGETVLNPRYFEV